MNAAQRMVLYAAVSAAAVAAAVIVAADGDPPTVTGPDPLGDRTRLAAAGTHTATFDRVTVTHNLGAHHQTVRVVSSDEGMRLDRIEVVCHGGLADIEWRVGNLEPTVPDTIIAIAVLMDGRPVSTLLKGSTRGIYDDGPVEARAVEPCPEGGHVFEAALVWVSGGGWGVPFVNLLADPPAPWPVRRGFVVIERW